MSRQCLYCAKELPKGTASNFCSKECWNEYKKLKSLNVDADKQATVLLKRSEMNSNLEDEQAKEIKESEPPTPPETAQEPASGSIAAMRQKIDKLEIALRSHLSDYENIQTYLDNISKSESEIPSDFTEKISQIEQNMMKVDELIRNVSKFEDRLITLEKRVKTFEHRESMASNVEKKGFFARLFG